MDVQSKNQVSAGYELHIFDDILVTLSRRNLLRPPVRKRMRCGGGQPQAILARQSDHVLPQTFEFYLRLTDIGADRSAYLDDRLVHLSLDALLQNQLSLLNDFGVDVRTQIPAFGVDGLIFLFDSERECGLHRGIQSCQ
jgi:hypothetical protein